MYDRLFTWFHDNAYIKLQAVENIDSLQQCVISDAGTQVCNVVIDESFCGAVFYSRHPQHIVADILTDKMRITLPDTVFCNTVEAIYDGIYGTMVDNPDGIKQLVSEGWSISKSVDDLFRAYVAHEVINGLKLFPQSEQLQWRYNGALDLWAAYGAGHDLYRADEHEGISIQTALSLFDAFRCGGTLIGFPEFYRKLYEETLADRWQVPIRLVDVDAKTPPVVAYKESVKEKIESKAVKERVIDGIRRMKLDR